MRCAWFTLSVLAVFSLAITQPAGRPEVPQEANGAVRTPYDSLPLSFEPNRGQTDGRVRFLARGPGYTLFLTSTSAVLSLYAVGAHGSPAIRSDLPRQPMPPRVDSHASAVLGIALLDANPSAVVEGVGPLPGKSHYFIGNTPARWRTDLPRYREVWSRGIYPGIDLRYYGNPRQLEYDFALAPGADPGVITLDLQGAGGLAVDGHGDLAVSAGEVQVRLHHPRAYQEVRGRRQPIRARYVLKGRHRVGFQLGAYDASRLVIIDPTLVYGTYLGGSGTDAGMGIAVDASGNAYVTGYTTSTDFPVKAGLQPALKGGNDAFIAKFDPTGSTLVYATYLGGSGDDRATGIAVDSAGSAYVVGNTTSNDFPTTAGAFITMPPAGSEHAFAAKLNAAGSALGYSTYLGGSGFDQGLGIAVDAAGNAYVAGYTSSPDFPTTAGALKTKFGGFAQGFVVKLNPTGAAVYATYLGGSKTADIDEAMGIAVDGGGKAYVTGLTFSTDFPTTAGAFRVTPAGEGDAFVSKLDASGSTLVYSTFLGGSAFDVGLGIAVDSAGDAYVTGSTNSHDFPITAGAYTSPSGGAGDAFVTKLNPAGSALAYSFLLGGSGFDEGTRIRVDSLGNAFVTGYTYSTDFPVTAGALKTTIPSGDANAFVVEVNPAGAGLVYSTYLGGSGPLDWGQDIAVDTSGNAYVTGFTQSTNFPTTAQAFQKQAPAGGTHAFVAKLAGTFPFSAFSVRVEVHDHGRAFEAQGAFALDPASSGIDPPHEAVTLQIGAFSATIPAGSFRKGWDGRFWFKGTINGDRLAVTITRHHDRNPKHRYDLTAEGKGASVHLAGLPDPVPVTLIIGDNNGATMAEVVKEHRDEDRDRDDHRDDDHGDHDDHH